MVVNRSNPITIAAAMTDWTVDAICGLWYFGCVLPSVDGNTFSRPSENRYRAVVLWNAMPHANDPVMITGLLRTTEPGGGFLRSNDPTAGRWYSRGVEAIARARGLRDTAPFFLDADATPNPGGYPVGGLTVIAFRNNQLVYALTWFALAALSVAGAVMAWRKEGTQ